MSVFDFLSATTFAFFLVRNVCIAQHQSRAPVASTVLEILLVSFDTKGLDDRSRPCDAFGNIALPCDPIFDFCIGSTTSATDVCEYWSGSENCVAYEDNNVVAFDEPYTQCGMSNPIVVNIADFQGFRFRVTSIDLDEGTINGNDSIDFTDYGNNEQPHRNRSSASANAPKITYQGTRPANKTDLVFVLMVYCDVHSYGTWCDVYCEAVDVPGEGHYTCDDETGQKICLEGWQDPENNCLTRENYCDHVTCHNGVCQELHGDFECLCYDGFTGQFCDSNIDDCTEDACENAGTCVDGIADFTCQCADMFAGDRCQYEICDVTRCENNGTCVVLLNGTLGCHCSSGFTGALCETPACDVLNCNNGFCADGICHCDEYFAGDYCDVRECELMPCANGGSCRQDGQCACTGEYTGRYCETWLDPCDNDPCLNGGVCYSSLGDGHFQCNCPDHFTGATCETFVPTTSPPSIDTAPPMSGEIDGSTSNESKEDVLTAVIVVMTLLLAFSVIAAVVGVIKYKKAASVANKISTAQARAAQERSETVISYVDDVTQSSTQTGSLPPKYTP